MKISLIDFQLRRGRGAGEEEKKEEEDLLPYLSSRRRNIYFLFVAKPNFLLQNTTRHFHARDHSPESAD